MQDELQQPHQTLAQQPGPADHQSTTPEDPCYPVLSVGLSDFEEAALDDDCLTDWQLAEQQKRLDFVRTMSPDQWKQLAEYMCDVLWDGDSWNEALQCGLSHVMACENVAADHPAMQKAAR